MRAPGQDLTARFGRVRAAIGRRSLLRNAGYIMLTSGANAALGYVFWLVVARSYDATTVGVASALIAAMTVAAAIANLGTSNALIQRLPSRQTAADWSRTLTASVATATVAGLFVGLVAGAVIVPALSPSLSLLGDRAGYLVLFVGGVVLWSLSVVSDFLWVAERRSENMLWRNVLFGAAKLAIVVALVAAGNDDAAGIFGSWVVGCALSLAAGYVLLMPRLRHRYHPTLAGIRGEVRAMATAFAGNYLITLGYLLTSFLLPLIVVVRLSAEQNAYFYVSWLLGGVFFTVTTSIGSALFAEGAHDRETLGAQTRSAYRISAALLAPLMLIFFVAGGWILDLFGARYGAEGRTLLLLLTAAAPLDTITGVYLARLRAEERLALPAATSLTMAAITLVGAWFLLPSMGLDGAGLAFVVGKLVGTAVCAVDALRTRAG
jgi:O-antigen/teichoic acid export membrane protein